MNEDMRAYAQALAKEKPGIVQRVDALEEEIVTKAPMMHAAEQTTYGVGSAALYGHVKLSDAAEGEETAADGGVAATPKAVKAAYDKAAEAQHAAEKAQNAANEARAAADGSGVEILTTSGTYTVKKTGVHIIYMAGGGSSGYALYESMGDYSDLVRHIGKNGEHICSVRTLTKGNSIHYTIGNGGAAHVNKDGQPNPGGDTTFDNLTAHGGGEKTSYTPMISFAEQYGDGGDKGMWGEAGHAGVIIIIS